MWGGGFGVLAVAVLLSVMGGSDWTLWASAVLGMIASIWIGAAWMASIDEAAREAHKWSWYWGGSVGLAVGGVLVILSTTPVARGWTVPVLLGDATPAGYAATGAMGILGLMMVSYLLAWGLWWLRRR